MAECIAYMKDPQNRIFIDSIDEHTTVDKMSDFECFAFLCSSVDDIIHSRFGRNFFELLFDFDFWYRNSGDALVEYWIIGDF